MPAKFSFDDPVDALDAIAAKIGLVSTETVSLAQASGRVLAVDANADRPSPAADVSAMDGYAIRLHQLKDNHPLVVDQSLPGRPMMDMPQQGVVRIFTGAIIPQGAEAIVKREDTIESGDRIEWRESALTASLGQHIRRCGENSPAGEVFLSSGQRMTAASVASLANFGYAKVSVFRKVKLAIVTTGDEVIPVDQKPEVYQLRNSNAASLSALASRHPCVELVGVAHAVDDQDGLEAVLRRAIDDADAVWLTGGVSMGDYDYVPDVVRRCGGEIVFHGLPIRPGKPILGASTRDGKAILGFPGNPVSATVNARRFGIPLLERAGGRSQWAPVPLLVDVESEDAKTLSLHQFRLVRIAGQGRAVCVDSQGSGDVVAMGQSDGFVAIPPHTKSQGRFAYFPWVS
jgi:molybdopterin molybdotransferase